MKEQIYYICEDFMNERLHNKVVAELQSENKKLKQEFINDFNEEHFIWYMITKGAFWIALALAIFFIGLLLCCHLSLKYDITKLNEQARVCQETGYGCSSHNINQDIKYDNTPIVEIENETHKH